MWNIYTFLSTFKLDIAKLLSYYQLKQHGCLVVSAIYRFPGYERQNI